MQRRPEMIKTSKRLLLILVRSDSFELFPVECVEVSKNLLNPTAD